LLRVIRKDDPKMIDYFQIARACSANDERKFTEVLFQLGIFGDGLARAAEQRSLRALMFFLRKKPLKFGTPIKLTGEEEHLLHVLGSMFIDGFCAGLRVTQEKKGQCND
jgi:hypothetical protein